MRCMCIQGRSQEGGGGAPPQTGVGLHRKNVAGPPPPPERGCLNPVWRADSEGSLSEPERSEAERNEAAGPEPTQQNWIQTNLATKRRDQTEGLIES